MLGGPLRNFFLSDFKKLPPTKPDLNRGESWNGQEPLSKKSAYEQMCRNAELLASLGAQFDEKNQPFDGVSGFEIQPEDQDSLPGLRPPASLGENPQKLKLLVWGSPHPATLSDKKVRGMRSAGAKCKTEAFESMAWQAPTGTIVMTFPMKFDVEFLQPKHNAFFPDRPADRLLLCGKMYSRLYVPMALNDGMRFHVPDTDRSSIMVAMLLAPEHVRCLSYRPDGSIDFGYTCFSILSSMKEREFGVALGVYDLSLEMEIYHAAKERLGRVPSCSSHGFRKTCSSWLRSGQNWVWQPAWH